MHINPDKWQQINKVLVVDDDDNWCFLSKKIIQKAGFQKEILTANNGKEAVKLLKLNLDQLGKLPELIFLDIKMPVMDGFEFLETVSKTEKINLSQTRIFVCSSSFNPKDKEKANLYPIAGFITKPLSRETLESILL